MQTVNLHDYNLTAICRNIEEAKVRIAALRKSDKLREFIAMHATQIGHKVDDIHIYSRLKGKRIVEVLAI